MVYHHLLTDQGASQAFEDINPQMHFFGKYGTGAVKPLSTECEQAKGVGVSRVVEGAPGVYAYIPCPDLRNPTLTPTHARVLGQRRLLR
jgi:hypothetical protein